MENNNNNNNKIEKKVLLKAVTAKTYETSSVWTESVGLSGGPT